MRAVNETQDVRLARLQMEEVMPEHSLDFCQVNTHVVSEQVHVRTALHRPPLHISHPSAWDARRSQTRAERKARNKGHER